MWSTPLQPGTCSACMSRIVCGWRKSSSRRPSATTIARRPSAVKYRLYGSGTGTRRPGRLVRGSIGVRLLPVSLVTHSVRRSHDGVTCCGSPPVRSARSRGRCAGDHVDRVGLRIRDVDPRGVVTDLRCERVRALRRVDILGVEQRRNADARVCLVGRGAAGVGRGGGVGLRGALPPQPARQSATTRAAAAGRVIAPRTPTGDRGHGRTRRARRSRAPCRRSRPR